MSLASSCLTWQITNKICPRNNKYRPTLFRVLSLYISVSIRGLSALSDLSIKSSPREWNKVLPSPRKTPEPSFCFADGCGSLKNHKTMWCTQMLWVQIVGPGLFGAVGKVYSTRYARERILQDFDEQVKMQIVFYSVEGTEGKISLWAILLLCQVYITELLSNMMIGSLPSKENNSGPPRTIGVMLAIPQPHLAVSHFCIRRVRDVSSATTLPAHERKSALPLIREVSWGSLTL